MKSAWRVQAAVQRSLSRAMQEARVDHCEYSWQRSKTACDKHTEARSWVTPGHGSFKKANLISRHRMLAITFKCDVLVILLSRPATPLQTSTTICTRRQARRADCADAKKELLLGVRGFRGHHFVMQAKHPVQEHELVSEELSSVTLFSYCFASR